MRTQRAAQWLGLAGFALSVVMSILLIFLPIYSSISTDSSGQEIHGTATLYQVNGYKIIPLLIIPVMLAGAAAVILWRTSPLWGGRRAMAWIAAVLLWMFVILGSFSIGLFYLPAALLIVVALVSAEIGRSKVVKNR